MANYMFCIILTVILFATGTYCVNKTFSLSVNEHDVDLLVAEIRNFSIILDGPVDTGFNLTLIRQHESLVNVSPSVLVIASDTIPDNHQKFDIKLEGLKPGHLEISAESTLNKTWVTENVFLRVTVAVSKFVTYVSVTFGWIYFLAWSVSFYPQIYINFKRKSVIGLNFDFLALNITGFVLYSVFNVGLYGFKEITDEYMIRHPRGVNPVLINDVFFSVHAAIATLVTIVQCYIYERGDQRVSNIARGLLVIFVVIVGITVGLAFGNVVHFLDFLYYCSYIKLLITLIKYIPQAVMNYRRKSTSGWSIGNILLDFTGGTLSMLQMILNAYNYDDWQSIFGDPTKFGLGLFSVSFDIFFMLQHYVFYRKSSSKEDNTSDTSAAERLQTK